MLRAIVRGYRHAFAGLPREVWILAAALFVNRLGMMVLPFLELYLIDERDLAVERAGLIVAVWGAGSIAGITLGGWLTDRLGPRTVQVASLALASVAMLVLWRMRSFAGIAGAAFAVSCVADAFRPANGAAISAASAPSERARAFSLMGLATNLGLSLALPLGGLLARIDFDWVFWIDAGSALVAACVLVAVSRRAPAHVPASAEERASGRSPWRDGRYLVVVLLMAVTVVVLFQFFGALPVYLKHDLGFDEAGVGLALALNTAVTSAFGMLVVRWAERKPLLRWLGVGSFLICAGYGLNALGTSLVWALGSIVVWSVGEMFFFPLGGAFATERAPKGAVGRYLGVYHLGFGLAFVASPIVGTRLYARVGPLGLWLFCAAVGVVVIAAFEALQRRDLRTAAAAAVDVTRRSA